jgi:hypothetical protein
MTIKGETVMETGLRTRTTSPLQAAANSDVFLRRKCDCGQHTVAGGGCSACEKGKGMLQRKEAQGEPIDDVPPIVHEVRRAVGQPLDSNTRAFLEPRFGHDFSQVRVHTDATAGESVRAVDAQAYTVGRDIAFEPGRYQPSSRAGLHLLAHELTHVVQQHGGPTGQKELAIGGENNPAEHEADQMADRVSSSTSPFPVQPVTASSASRGLIQPYRSKSAFNFGRNDSSTLKEETFTDAKKQPWVEQITIQFDATAIDTNGDLIPTGTLKATYKSNGAAFSDITLPISGGSVKIGLSDKVTDSTIKRIEGIGYNDQPLTVAEGGEPANKKYAKSLTSSMSYAMFYQGKQAIHIGKLNLGSHACVHGGSDATAWELMRQLNYHSVEGRTKVTVGYDAGVLKDLCCARMAFLGVKKKGEAPNPCGNADPKACP